MSTPPRGRASPDQHQASAESIAETTSPPQTGNHGNYNGFVAGVFSGIAKLSVGHPYASEDSAHAAYATLTVQSFDTIKTLRREGVPGLYKGATPPLIGWMFMDSVMLGSLTFYRRLLNEHVFNSQLRFTNSPPAAEQEVRKLPSFGHGIAGIMAGWTVSFIAAPVEHIKARLQVQYAADKSKRLYRGPIDCATKIYLSHGVRGIYHGLSATLLFRTFFFFWWSSYDVLSRVLSTHTSLSTPAINFWAGGLSAQVFWITSYPGDVVKQRILTDPLGEGRRFPHWRDAATSIWRETGWRGYWRGFLPCFLRAFPANAMALVAFEGVMRALP